MGRECKLGSRQAPLKPDAPAPERTSALIATQLETGTLLTSWKQTPRPISNRYTFEGTGL